jgi:hypothetical protein
MTGTVALEDRLPTADAHRRLAEGVGWGPAFDWPCLPASLAGSTLGWSPRTAARWSGRPAWSATA